MRVQRTGPPSFGPTQREQVLTALRNAGKAGVPREHFLFSMHITQVGARISELIEMGYRISSKWAAPLDKYVTYFLDFEPVKPVPYVNKYKSTRPGPETIVSSSTATVGEPRTLFDMTPTARVWHDPEQQ